MYEISDTIAAVSSPAGMGRVIIRIAGADTVEILKRIFQAETNLDKTGIFSGNLVVDAELQIEAMVYLFLSPWSYTGDTLAEIHAYTSQAVSQTVMETLFSGNVRCAEPGEFTARAYMNGKIDLAQAEAVGQIVASANRFQLAAAEKLLAGKLSQTTAKIRKDIMECMGLIEAGLDFSQHDIEFITNNQAIERLVEVQKKLEGLLAGSISYESVIDLPAVGIAGSPNAGKSTLLNKLLGQNRSIVSSQAKTTRDVLSGIVELQHNRCVLFDCAGLISKPVGIMDRLAQRAAIEALDNSQIVLFCVDISRKNFCEDIAIGSLIDSKNIIAVATKTDLIPEDIADKQVAMLEKLFGIKFLQVSCKADLNLNELQRVIDQRLVTVFGDTYDRDDMQSQLTLTARHKTSVNDAIKNIEEAIIELKNDQSEIAAMMMRSAFRDLAGIEQEHVDEQILHSIFSKFCIGK